MGMLVHCARVKQTLFFICSLYFERHQSRGSRDHGCQGEDRRNWGARHEVEFLFTYI